MASWTRHPPAYMIRINGHLGATMLSAFPALAPQHHGAHTVLTGLLDRSALYGVLAEIEALGLDLLEIQKLTPDRKSPEQVTAAHRTLGLDLLELRKLTPGRESPGTGHHRSP